MKVLFYNWVDYLDAEKRGGGVTIYQQNLIKELARREDIETLFLSSGISYDLLSSKPRWERVRHNTTGPISEGRYEIVNSGVLAPSHFSFGKPAQVDHPETVAKFFDFIEEKGPFDVIHFNNLEGLPATALDIKARWPQTRVVLTLHNYYPICPQVNLWQQETAHCADFKGGEACRTCIPAQPDERSIRLANAVAFRLKKWRLGPGTRVFDLGFTTCMRIARRVVRLYGKLRRVRLSNDDMGTKNRKDPRIYYVWPSGEFPINPTPAAEFSARRARFRDLINANCDHVLGVSGRVSEIACAHGIRPELVRTAYIGTQHFEKFQETAPKPSLLDSEGILTLGYLGYMRRDKGFYFLLDALETLPEDLAGRVRLVIGAKRGPEATMKKLAHLSGRVHEIIYADGYTHDQLDDLLESVTLGVVPVMWEDNLPQVAIEMHARHIPLLTSTRGGAQELGNFPGLVFKAGDTASFAERIQSVLQGDIDIEAYWNGAMPPVAMERHIEAMLDLYRGGGT